MDKYYAIQVSQTENFDGLYLYVLDATSAGARVVAAHWDKLESRPWSLIGDEPARNSFGGPIIDKCDRKNEREQIQSRR